MKLSDYVIDVIVKEGVSHIYEMIGGAIAHLLDSASVRDDIECVSVHHEQAAAFAAEGYARINGRLGVAMATSGPGALNMVTGIGSCFFDSVPCLFITGQVNTYEYKFDRPVRQIGFQETDIVSIVKPITKYAYLVTDASEIRYQLEKAIYLAQSGRPGPVLLDIPMNIQRQHIEPEKLESFYDSDEFRAMQAVYSDRSDEVVELISKAERPVILVGGGVRGAGATEELVQFVSKTGIPVVNSLMGIDAIAHSHESYFGLIGSYGNRYSNLALANCDLLIILGSRLDTRQTGTRVDTFARAAHKVHVDIDNIELNAKVNVDLAIHSNVKDFLQQMNNKLNNLARPDLSAWYKTIESYKSKFPTKSSITTPDKIEPNSFVKYLSGMCSEGDAICLDVGQHQMWASQSFEIKQGQRLLNSGGMGAMGFALPAAIGSAKTGMTNNVIVIAGDGGIQVNIQELDIVAQHNLPIKIFILNNRNLGMVRTFQDLYFDGRQQSTVKGYNCPDLNAIAKAYGIPSFNITSMEDAEEVCPKVMEMNGPAFVNVELEVNTVVDPKLVVNRPIEDMYPHLDREQLKEIMLIELVKEIDVPK